MSGEQIEAKIPAFTRRRRISQALKRQIVDESNAPGASVSAVARKHDVNANQLFKWRLQYGRGAGAVPLVSVHVRPDQVPAIDAGFPSDAPFPSTKKTPRPDA